MARKSQTSICYVLREPNCTSLTPIVGLVHFNNQRVKISTGFKVLPSHWNFEKCRVRNTLEVTNRDTLNTYLKALEDEVESIINNLKANRQTITKEIVKERINQFLNPKPNNTKPKTILEFSKAYIDSCTTRIVRSKGSRSGRTMSPNTIRRYKTTLNGLELFSQTYSRALVFDNIDLQFYKAFVEWLTNKNYSTNNVSKYIENLKGFMNVAYEEGYTTNQEYRKFSNMREEADNIYLSESELDRIYSLDLSKIKRLEQVRDLFIIASWTGLRFSDFSTLLPEHIQTDDTGNKYIDLRQQKTSARVQIPILHYAVEEILEKYSNILPKGISNQKTNDYLKEICKIAEVNKRELKHITKGGKQIIKTSKQSAINNNQGAEKWELVSCHTARRSFATNMFKRKMPTVLIMKLTGHKKESEFLKYIKVTPEETLDLMRSFSLKRIEP